MASHASVGVHDDLAAGKSSIALWSTNYESARGVDEVTGAVKGKIALPENRSDDVVQDEIRQIVLRHIRVMLGR